MFTVKFGGTTWVFLNSSRVVTDLLERRAAVYSSRPPFPMTQDIMSGGSRIVLMLYGDRWRRTRKIMHQILSTRQKDVFQPFQDLESKNLLYDYLHKPDKWYLAGRFANSVIMSIVFGTRSSLDDPEVVALFETLEMFLEEQQPGRNVVDGFPVLANLPKILQWWRPRGERIFKITREVYKKQLDRVRDRIKKGVQKDCFAVDFLKSTDNDPFFNETQRLFVLGTLMEAGSDTSRVSIGQMVAAAATYPDWVVRAREQLDKVCGANAERLPEWVDRENLPYITATVKEIFR